MSATWQQIAHIMDGEAVAAGVAGRPDRQLEANLNRLRDLVELSLLGRALIAYDLAADAAVQVGQPVYWDADNLQCNQAMARLVFNSDLGTLVGAPESDVLGVVLNKRDSGTVDVVIVGWVPLDLELATADTPTAGRYYLSGNTPGYLVQARPSLSLPILQADGRGNALVFPQFRNWAEDHTHYRLSLACRPAGSHELQLNGCGETIHVISEVDIAIAGWLPADHATFADKAPAGALFGYNMAAQPQLERLWPPLPVEAASIIWDRGADAIGGTEVPSTLVTIDRNGIWWMSDCLGSVPWPAEDYLVGSSEVSVPFSETPCVCPPAELMQMAVCFSRTLFDASRTVVTSLTPAANSVITIVGCDGEAARTGDLIIDALLDLLVDDNNADGHLVLKTITNSRFKQGPVVEGIVAIGDSLSVSSTAQQTLTGGAVLHQGRVSMTVVLEPAARELLPQVTRLSNSRERFESNTPYIGLPISGASSVAYTYYVPPAGVVTDAPLVFRLTLIGTASGALPTLECEWKRIPRGSTTPAAMPATLTALTGLATPTLGAASEYVEVESDEVTVQPGDTLVLTITRASGDAYTGEVGIVRASAVLT